MRILKVRYGKGEKFPRQPWAIVTTNNALIGYAKTYLEARSIIDSVKNKTEEGKSTDRA